MNALTTIQPQVPAFTMSDMERVALAIAKGGLFGSTDPNAVLTLCMLAQAEGQHPAVVFRDYHIISGKPSKKAEAMQRDFLAAGGKIEWHRLDDECADATFSHPQGGTARISWDKARVAQAQLGGNAMHKKYPRQMLRSRVISEGTRTVFPAATSGLYETGEVQDMVTQDRPTPPVPVAQRARDLKPDKPAISDQRSAGREKAEEWLGGYIDAIGRADTVEDLDDILGGGTKALAKLHSAYPDLHEQAAQAAADRQRYFAEQGEAHTGAADAIIAEINQCDSVPDINSYMATQSNTLKALDADDRERIAIAQDERAAEIKGQSND